MSPSSSVRDSNNRHTFFISLHQSAIRSWGCTQEELGKVFWPKTVLDIATVARIQCERQKGEVQAGPICHTDRCLPWHRKQASSSCKRNRNSTRRPARITATSFVIRQILIAHKAVGPTLTGVGRFYKNHPTIQSRTDTIITLWLSCWKTRILTFLFPKKKKSSNKLWRLKQNNYLCDKIITMKCGTQTLELLEGGIGREKQMLIPNSSNWL